MITKTYIKREEGVMPVSKLGQRRQVVIPKEACEELGLRVGDFVEVQVTRGTVVIKPKKLVDADDVLSAREEALVAKGEAELRRGEYITLKEFKHEVGSATRKNRGTR